MTESGVAHGLWSGDVALGEFLRGVFQPWWWARRRTCHGTHWPCQKVDRPNDNNPSRPRRWGLRWLGRWTCS